MVVESRSDFYDFLLNYHNRLKILRRAIPNAIIWCCHKEKRFLTFERCFPFLHLMHLRLLHFSFVSISVWFVESVWCVIMSMTAWISRIGSFFPFPFCGKLFEKKQRRQRRKLSWNCNLIWEKHVNKNHVQRFRIVRLKTKVNRWHVHDIFKDLYFLSMKQQTPTIAILQSHSFLLYWIFLFIILTVWLHVGFCVRRGVNGFFVFSFSQGYRKW
jgi:hypothetical protein